MLVTRTCASFLVLLTTIFLTSPAARSQSDHKTMPAFVDPQASHLSPEYERWLDEDVRWIITRQERAEFLSLTNKPDRDRFIEMFWLRRDPTPGTSENEYKEEHYRRIAYANAHFASKIPGWSTDRGRSYILLGPPDSIQTYVESGFSKATEVWHYHAVPGDRNETDLRFVDSCSCGDYRLQESGK